MCVCTYVQGVVFVAVCVFPAVASAGATVELYPVCVSLKYFIRSSRQLQTGLICVVSFNVSPRVCLCHSVCAYV